MVDTRETRSAAAEIKFVVDAADAPRIRAWARTHLQPDPHGTGPCGDEYEITSLYFDTRALDVFHRRGSYARAKYRIRRYGREDVLFLERKLRRPGVLVKRRTLQPSTALDRLASGEKAAWPGRWFERRLAARRLHPVCQVSYHRMARMLDDGESTARLTLDSGLRVSAIDEARFTGDPGIPFLEDRVIVELKYRGLLPAAFRRLIEDFALVPAVASKYRLGMAALGHASVAEERSIAVDGGVSYA